MNLQLSNKKDNAGNAFYENEAGSIDLWQLPQEIFDKIRRQNSPVRLTDYNLQHILLHHGIEFEHSEQNVVNFINSILIKFTHIRANKNALLVTIENKCIGRAALILLRPSALGNYYNVETAGYRNVKRNLEKYDLLLSESATEPHYKEAVSSDALPGLSNNGTAMDTIGATSISKSDDKGRQKLSNDQKISSQPTKNVKKRGFHL